MWSKIGTSPSHAHSTFSLSIATTFCMFEYENAAARGRTFDVAAADCDDGRAEIYLHDAGVSVEF